MNKIFDQFEKFFKDNKGRMIYYVPKEKTGYIVPSHDVRLVNILHQRVMVVVLVALVMYFFNIDIIIIGFVLIGGYVAMSWFLKNRMLATMTSLANYDLKKNTEKVHTEQELKKSLRNSYFTLILALVFIGLSIWGYFAVEVSRTQGIMLILVGSYFLFTAAKNIIYLHSQEGKNTPKR